MGGARGRKLGSALGSSSAGGASAQASVAARVRCMCACLLVVRFHRLAAEEALDGTEDLLDGAVDLPGDAVEEALRGGVSCEALLAATRAREIWQRNGVGRKRRREKGGSAAEAA